MCGRYAASRRPEDLVVEFEAQNATGGQLLPADFNVAPTKDVHAVLVRGGVRQLRVLNWGLVPSWAADAKGGARMINARAETIADKPAFRSAVARRRCLLPADGWYEWVTSDEGTARQPYFITPLDGSVLAFAGLYEVRGELVTCTIVTTAAWGPLTEVHDRMPVVLGRAHWAAWLDPTNDDAGRLLQIPDSEILAGLELRPVGSAVGNVDNNGPELVAPISAIVPQTLF